MPNTLQLTPTQQHTPNYQHNTNQTTNRYFAEIFNRSSPAPGTAFPLAGCVVGCIDGLEDGWLLG